MKIDNQMKEKAISIKQPWAYLLCAGIKPIENRTWSLPEKHKGERVFIHASGKPDKEPYMLFSDEQADAIDNIIMDVCGAYEQTSQIIGSVRFIDCVINHPSIWAEKSPMEIRNGKEFLTSIPIYNWVAADPILFDKPILNVKGKLSFWDCSSIIHSDIDEDGKSVCMCNLRIDEKDQVSSFEGINTCKYCGGKWYK